MTATERPSELFAIGDIVRHTRSGHTYSIVGRCVIEATLSDCYAYRGTDGVLWIRPVGEMEDGRFERIGERTLDAAPTDPVVSAECWREAIQEMVVEVGLSGLYPEELEWIEQRAIELAREGK